MTTREIAIARRLVHVGPLNTGASPYGLPAMSRNRVPGAASVTVSSSPGPSRTSCGGFARRAFAPNAASPSSM